MSNKTVQQAQDRLLIKDMPPEICRAICASWNEHASIWPKCGRAIFDGPWCAWTLEKIRAEIRQRKLNIDTGKLWVKVIKSRMRYG